MAQSSDPLKKTHTEMKRFIIAIACMLSLCNLSMAQKYYQKVKIKTLVDSISYSIGAMLAQNMVKEGISDFNVDALGKAFCDVINNNTLAVSTEDGEAAIRNLFAKIEQMEEKEAREKEKVFLENNAKDPGVKVTESGLQYVVVKEGNGPKPNDNSRVKVHYEGKLTTGDVFDSSFDNDEPVDLDVDMVIAGMSEGLKLMSEGSEYILYIPFDLGYGSYSPGEILPAYSTLIFNVELISVQDKPADEEGDTESEE